MGLRKTKTRHICANQIFQGFDGERDKFILKTKIKSEPFFDSLRQFGFYAASNTGVGEIGSYQEDAFQGHAHDIEFKANNVGGPGQAHMQANPLAVFTPESTQANTPPGGAKFLAETPVEFGSDGTPRISTETRPKNAYVYYIIKY